MQAFLLPTMAKMTRVTALFLASCLCVSSCFRLLAVEDCNGTPCKCYDDLGCFPNRPECDEDGFSILPESPEKIGTKFLLFTSSSQTTGALITYTSTRSELLNAGYNPSRDTKFIIHGFINSAESDGIADIRDAFLATGSYNIIMVDWKTGADIGFDDIIKFWTIYRQSSQNTRVVAKQLHLLLEQLRTEVSLGYDDAHLIGHSLGAQIAGLAAAYITGGVGRISGLDPAKPNFEGKNTVCRLDENDASLVDVIHTDIEKFGTNEQSGDMDFWPNDGKEQPGCVLLGCSHGRSTEYYAISILGSCPYSSQPCDGSSCRDCPRMGIDADKTALRGNYCLTTTEKKPYC